MLGCIPRKKKRDNLFNLVKSFPRKTSWMSLNDDCWMVILETMSLRGLCAISRTCERLQQLSLRIFQIYHPKKAMSFKGTFNQRTGHFDISREPVEDYVKFFTMHITCVTIADNFEDPPELTQFCGIYNENSCPITTLHLKYWTIRTYDDERSLEFNRISKGVESLIVENIIINDNFNKHILQHFPNLKRLTLRGYFSNGDVEGNVSNNWIRLMYPQLEYFAWHVREYIPIEQIQMFLANNPNIKSFSLYSSLPDTITRLINSKLPVDEFYYVFPNKNQFLTDLDDLRTLCENNLAKRLHLKFSNSILYDISYSRNTVSRKLNFLDPYINGIYFVNENENNLIARLAKHQMPNLKVIQMYVNSDIEWLARKTKLKEVYLHHKVDDTNAMAILAEQIRRLNLAFSERLQNKENVPILKVFISSKFHTCEVVDADEMGNRMREVREVLRTETEILVNPLVNFRDPFWDDPEYELRRQTLTTPDNFFQ